MSDEHDEFWIHCPSDILMLIFKRLDVKSLINCMSVTKSWSDTVYYYCQHYKLWDKMVEQVINKRCITYKEKSNLDEGDLFLSATHWLNIKKPLIKPHRYHCVEHNDNVTVFKGTLIFTSHITDSIIFYIKNRSRSYNTCLNYVETSSLIADLNPCSGGVTLHVLTCTNKLYQNLHERTDMEKISFSKCTFKVHLNACYVIDDKNVLRVYTAHEGKWHSKFLAKYYGFSGSIITIHIHYDDIYILNKSGTIFKVDLNYKMFERLFHLDAPLPYFDRQMFMFHKYSVVMKVPCDETYYIYPQKGRKQVVVACPDLSCCLEHGPVLITGYHSGKIEIFLIDNLVNGNRSPVLKFYLQSYANLRCYEIRSIDVYEDTDGHHLFIASHDDTYDNIHELLIN